MLEGIRIGPAHAIEHELSALYDVAHGAGLAVVFPAWMTYVMKHDINRFAQIAVRVWGCEMNFANPEETAKEGIKRFKEFLMVHRNACYVQGAWRKGRRYSFDGRKTGSWRERNTGQLCTAKIQGC